MFFRVISILWFYFDYFFILDVFLLCSGPGGANVTRGSGKSLHSDAGFFAALEEGYQIIS
jgi:hypothetical protein